MNRETPQNSQDRHLGFDRRQDLLHGLLDPQTREVALAHLRRCPACEEAFRFEAGRLERLRGSADHRRAADGDAGRVRPLRLRLPARAAWGIGLAAAAIIAFTFLWPRGDAADERLFRLPPPGESLLLRDDGGTRPSGALGEGLAAYAREDYAAAAVTLAAATADGAWETLRRVYLGSAHALRGDSEAAVAVLEDLDWAVLPDPWGGEAAWTLFISLRAAGHGARADSLLEAIAAEGGEPGRRARDLLSERLAR